MISDTTISAAKGVNSEMKDKFKMNFFIALPAAIFATIMIKQLVNSITSKIKNRKNAEYGIRLISELLSATLVNNTIAIIITAPIAKETGQKYNIVPKRLASLIDILLVHLQL